MESNLRKSVMSLLADHPNAYGLVTTGVNKNGAPDVVGSIGGRSFVWELKQPGKRPRKLQKIELTKWFLSGAFADVVTTVEQARELLESYQRQTPKKARKAKF